MIIFMKFCGGVCFATRHNHRRKEPLFLGAEAVHMSPRSGAYRVRDTACFLYLLFAMCNVVTLLLFARCQRYNANGFSDERKNYIPRKI